MNLTAKILKAELSEQSVILTVDYKGRQQKLNVDLLNALAPFVGAEGESQKILKNPSLLDVLIGQEFNFTVSDPGSLTSNQVANVSSIRSKKTPQVAPLQPTEWPAPDKDSPFTAIPVPYVPESGTWRIGHAIVPVCPNVLNYSRTSQIKETGTLRSGTPMKQADGAAYETYNISYVLNGPEEIVRGGRDVLEQVMLYPFQCVEGGPFGTEDNLGVLPTQEIAVRSYSVSTLPGQPDSLKVDLQVEPFYWDRFMSQNSEKSKAPRGTLSDAICWPLWSIWVKDRSRSSYKPPSGLADGQPSFSCNFSLRFPSPTAIKSINEIAKKGQARPISSDYQTAQTLKSKLIGGEDPTPSRHLKPIQVGQTQSKNYIVKINQPQKFSQITKIGTGVQPPSFYLGLVWWADFSGGFTDNAGNAIPQGDIVTSYYNPSKGKYITNPLEIVHIQRGVNFDVALQAFLESRGLGATFETVKNNLSAYFGVVINVNPGQEKEVVTAFETGARGEDKEVTYNDEIEQFFESKDYLIEDLSLDLSNDEEKDSDIVLESVSAMGGHHIALQHTAAASLPYHSYIGGMSKVFIVRGTAFGLAAVKKLQAIKATFDERSRMKKSKEYLKSTELINDPEYVATFMQVKNDLFDLMGVKFVLPISLDITSVDGQPDAKSFNLVLTDFDPRSQFTEKMRFLPTYNQTQENLLYYWDEHDISILDTSGANEYTTHPTILKAQDWFSLQDRLYSEQVFTDLELPSRSEMIDWLQACREVAQQWEGQKKEISSVSSRYKYLITPYLNNPVFNFNSEVMAKWPNPTINDISGGFYCDADFFVSYQASDYFSNMLDAVATSVLGAPEPNMAAKGSALGDTVLRLVDEEFGVLSGVDQEALASKMGGLSGYEDMLHRNMESITEGKTASEIKEIVDEALLEQEQEGKALGWWIGDLGQQKIGDETVYTIPSDVFSGKQNKLPSAHESIKKIVETQIGRDFYSLSWRRDITQKAASFGLSNIQDWEIPKSTTGLFGLSITDKYSNAGFSSSSPYTNFALPEKPEGLFLTRYSNFYGQSSGVEKYLSLSELALECVRHQTRIAKPGATATSTQFQTPLKVTAQKRNQTDKVTLEDKTIWPSFTGMTAIINSVYKSADTNSLVSLQNLGGSNLDERIRQSLPAYSYVGKIKKIDPILLSAYFSIRTSHGLISSNDNSAQSGFGDFDRSRLPSSVETPAEEIEHFATVFLNYRKKVGSTTLALALADWSLTSKSQFSLEKEPEIIDAFKKANIKAAGKLPPEAGKILREAMTAAGFNLAIVDSYYRAYIETGRRYGVIFDKNFNNSSDPYFSPNNPGFYIDPSPNIDTEERTGFFDSDTALTGMLVDHTPSGIPTKVIADRQRVSPLGSAENGSISAEARAQLALRQWKALSPHTEDAIWGMMSCLRKFSPFGRLSGAFPSYTILFINEGFYFRSGPNKLWDQFYTRAGVHSIEVFRSRLEPADTARVTISNVYKELTRYTAQLALIERLQKEERERFFEKLSDPFATVADIIEREVFKKPTPEVLEVWKKNHLNLLMLTAGSRLQIRMGYGSDASKLPVIFNGTVAEVPVGGEEIQVIAYGDGAELKKPTVNKLKKVENGFAYVNTGFAGIAKSPSNIIVESLINLDGVEALGMKMMGGLFRDWSHGIAHFGDVYFKGAFHYPTELLVNIYDSSLTKIEQGVPGYKNFFNDHGLYTWDNDKIWFTVSVNEPTVWKVAQVCKYAVMDFVTSAEPFATESRLFYGKWWWPLNYGYKPSILDAALAPPDLVQSQGNLNAQEISIESIRKKYGDKLADAIQKDFPGDKVVRIDTQNTKLQSLRDSQDKSRLEAATQRLFADTPQEAEAMRQRQIQPPVTKENTNISTNYIVFFSNKTVAEYSDADFKLIKTRAITSNELRVHFNAPVKTSVVPFEDVSALVAHLEWMPYTQVYIADGLVNLIKMDIRADSQGMATDAIGLHTYNGFMSAASVERNMTVSIDDDIQPVSRQTMIADTGIMLTGVQGWWDQGTKDFTAAAGFLIPGLNEFIRGIPPTPAVQNGVINRLLDSVKLMYKGNITILGQPTMKPNDIVYVNDQKTGLKGPVMVREVLHSLSPETGFITIFEPDAIVLPQVSHQGLSLIQTLVGVTLPRLTALMGLKKTAAAVAWATRKFTPRPNLTKAQAIKNLKPEYYRQSIEYVSTLEDLNVDAGEINKQYFNQYVSFLKELDGSLSGNSKEVNNLKKSLGEFIEYADSFANGLNFENVDIDELLQDFEKAVIGAFSEGDKEKVFNKIKYQQFLSSLPKDLAAIVEKPRSFTTVENIAGVPNAALKATRSLEVKIKMNELYSELSEAYRSVDQDISLLTGEDPLSLSGRSENVLLGHKNRREMLDEIERIRGERMQAVLDKPYYKEVVDYLSDAKSPLRGDPYIIKLKRELQALKATIFADERVKLERIAEMERVIFKAEQAIEQTAAKNAIGSARLHRTIDQQVEDVVDTMWDLQKTTDDDVIKKVFPLLSPKGSRRTLRAGEKVVPVLKTNPSAEDFIKSLLKGATGKDKMSQIKNLWNNVKSKDILKSSENAFKLLPNMIRRTAFAARVGMYAGPQAIVALAVDASFMVVGETVLNAFNHRLKSRQVAKIVPLFNGTVPFVAGIVGHAGAVIGDDPSFLDKIQSEYIGGVADEPNGLMQTTILLSEIFGIESPSLLPTDLEIRLRSSLQGYDEPRE